MRGFPALGVVFAEGAGLRDLQSSGASEISGASGVSGGLRCLQGSGTSGAIMGGLALARIEWTTWLKFALKIVVVLSVVSAVICTVAIMVL